MCSSDLIRSDPFEIFVRGHLGAGVAHDLDIARQEGLAIKGKEGRKCLGEGQRGPGERKNGNGPFSLQDLRRHRGLQVVSRQRARQAGRTNDDGIVLERLARGLHGGDRARHGAISGHDFETGGGR